MHKQADSTVDSGAPVLRCRSWESPMYKHAGSTVDSGRVHVYSLLVPFPWDSSRRL